MSGIVVMLAEVEKDPNQQIRMKWERRGGEGMGGNGMGWMIAEKCQGAARRWSAESVHPAARDCWVHFTPTLR